MSGRCAVPWCVHEDCSTDHWASPGDGDWPFVEATSYAPSGRQYVAAAPTWCEMEGDVPAVLVWFQRVNAANVCQVDESFDFTPAEARELAARLIAAAEAAGKATGAKT